MLVVRGLLSDAIAITIVALITFPAAASQTQYLEGVVEASGANNSHYTSTVNFYNPGPSANAVEVRYVTNFSTVLGPYRFTLRPNETLHKERFAALFQEGNIYGTLVITSEAPIVVSGQTLNDADRSRTYGLGLIPQQELNVLAPPQVGHTNWTTNNTAYRTNLQITFLEPGEVHINITRDDGKPMKFQRVLSNSASCWQVPLATLLEHTTYSGDSGKPLDQARVEYRVVSGKVLALAVVNDNVTSDGIIIHAQTFDPTAGTAQKFVVGGISEAPGMNGTYWRTKGRFNCVMGPCIIKAIAVLNHLVTIDGEPNYGGVGIEYHMYTGQYIATDDLLATMAIQYAVGGRTVGYENRAGMMIVETQGVTFSFATANVDPTGVRQGSFAADTQPVPYERAFLRKQGGKGVFIGVDQTMNTPGYRSNIAFLTMTQCDTKLHFRVLSQSGSVVGEKDVTISGKDDTLVDFICDNFKGWVQKNAADWLEGIALPEAATIEITNLDAKTDVFAAMSRIDNATGDPAIYNVVVLP